MIDYKLFQYAGPPRCGSTWVLKAAQLCELGTGFKPQVHIPHAGGERGPKLRVSTMRSPCDWLLSYWSEIRGGFTGVDVIDKFSAIAKGSETFAQFIKRYLDEMPGSVGEMFYAYRADSYIPVSELPWAFVELLESCGVPVGIRNRCLTLGPQNATIPTAVWDRGLKIKVIMAEEKVYDEFEF